MMNMPYVIPIYKSKLTHPPTPHHTPTTLTYQNTHHPHLTLPYTYPAYPTLPTHHTPLTPPDTTHQTTLPHHPSPPHPNPPTLPQPTPPPLHLHYPNPPLHLHYPYPPHPYPPYPTHTKRTLKFFCS